MSGTVTVCTVDELPEGSMRLVEADGHKVGVFNCGGNLYVPVRTPRGARRGRRGEARDR